jgi:hypothetical protein
MKKWLFLTARTPNADWNKDLTMTEASKFRGSLLPGKEEGLGHTHAILVRQLSYAAKYGRAVIHNDVDMFWLNNDEKLLLMSNWALRKNYISTSCPFRNVQDIVKK